MHSITYFAFSFAIFALTKAAEVAVPAEAAPTSKDLSDQLRTRIFLAKRIDQLAFCYGRNSICEESNALHALCDPFDNFDNSAPWYKCLCENGFVSTREACGWCDTAFGLSGDVGDLYSAQCTSYSATIAPIPTSILALESTYNATFTGSLPAGVTLTKNGGAATTGSGPVTKAPSTTTTTTSAGKTTTTPLSKSTFTLNGGADPTTTSQNLVATVTVAPSVVLTVAGGGAAGLQGSKGSFLSILVVGITMAFIL